MHVDSTAQIQCPGSGCQCSRMRRGGTRLVYCLRAWTDSFIETASLIVVADTRLHKQASNTSWICGQVGSLARVAASGPTPRQSAQARQGEQDVNWESNATLSSYTSPSWQFGVSVRCETRMIQGSHHMARPPIILRHDRDDCERNWFLPNSDTQTAPDSFCTRQQAEAHPRSVIITALEQ